MQTAYFWYFLEDTLFSFRPNEGVDTSSVDIVLIVEHSHHLLSTLYCTCKYKLLAQPRLAHLLSERACIIN